MERPLKKTSDEIRYKAKTEETGTKFDSQYRQRFKELCRRQDWLTEWSSQHLGIENPYVCE